MREATSTQEQITNQVQSLEKELAELKSKEAELDKFVFGFSCVAFFICKLIFIFHLQAMSLVTI